MVHTRALAMEPVNEYGGRVLKSSDTFKSPSVQRPRAAGAVVALVPATNDVGDDGSVASSTRASTTSGKTVRFAPPEPPWRFTELRERREARKIGDQLDAALRQNLQDKAARAEAEREALRLSKLRSHGLAPMTEDQLAAHREDLRKMRVVIADKKSWEYRLGKQGTQQLLVARQLRDMESVQEWSRKSRDKLTTLDDLEKRVKGLLVRLAEPPQRTLRPAKDEVADELAALEDDSDYMECALCGRKFLQA